MDIEEWRAIPGYEGIYEASTTGRVRSLSRITPHGHRWRGRMMTPTLRNDGYFTVTLWRLGRQKSHLLHRLILLAFTGAPEPEQEALHGDGDRSNNALSNLSWGTHSENQFDQVAHGAHSNASKTHCKQGHPFTPENTYLYPRKRHRACRICRAAYIREYHRLARLGKSA